MSAPEEDGELRENQREALVSAAWSGIVAAGIILIILAMLAPILLRQEATDTEKMAFRFLFCFPVGFLLGGIGIWRKQEWARALVDWLALLLLFGAGILFGGTITVMGPAYMILSLILSPTILFVAIFLVSLILTAFSLRWAIWKDPVVQTCRKTTASQTLRDKKIRLIQNILALAAGMILGIIWGLLSNY
jgi:hypothetical protein